MKYRAELVGGPQDGKRCTMSHDLPIIRVLGHPMPAEYSKESDSPHAKPPTEEYEYFRTKNVNSDGYRVYGYSELKRE